MWIDPRFQARNIVIKPNQGFYVLPFENGPKNAMSAIKDEITRQNLDCELIKSEDRFDPTRGNNWSPVNKIDNLNRDFFVLCHD